MNSTDNINIPQCQFFVTRKKRLCRMTVRPGRQYCGEHEPQPLTKDLQVDTRIPCPYDNKHTCYASKLEKHLLICNARQNDQLPYIKQNVNVDSDVSAPARKLLSEISKEDLMKVIDKVNLLYEEHVNNKIRTFPEHSIHDSVQSEFSETHRTETSLRHFRQASNLLWLTEENGLVKEGTCFVELGAGKGILSYYMCLSWCRNSSKTLALDRSSLRHKKDNKLSSPNMSRLRADIAHLALDQVEEVISSQRVVGMAKHLCGVATDYALLCVTSKDVLPKTRGVVMATCCHHRCELHTYVGRKLLNALNLSDEDLNIMFSIVSWATCGDGKSRDQNKKSPVAIKTSSQEKEINTKDVPEETIEDALLIEEKSKDAIIGVKSKGNDLCQEYREMVGRKAKALIDWGRILFLREKGFETDLYYYVPTSVSLENMCIVAR